MAEQLATSDAGPAWRFAHGSTDPKDIAFVQQRLQAHCCSDDGIPLERRLQLPSTAGRVRKRQRDARLCAAARCMDLPADVVGLQARAALLARQWQQFVTRGPWVSWRDDDAPPAGTPAFYEELFHATRHTLGEKRYLDERQVRRIAGHVLGLR